MAKLEIVLKVDADGLLGVHAKEEVTGIEARVDVKPSYGLDDEAVEKMLMDALDHGEDDLLRRRIAENRIEARRIIDVTAKAIATDPELLAPGEKASIERAMAELDAATQGDDPGKMHLLVEELDKTSKEFATRRMNRAIARAIAGRTIDDVERGGAARR
jgi:molecular chaperone HscA